MINGKILAIEKLKKYFNIASKGRVPMFVRAVDGVDFYINTGETLGLIGESGSGKSTIAYCVVGMYNPTAGKIIFKNENLGGIFSKRPLSSKKEIQIVFQDPGSSLNPRQTIEQIISLPLRVHAKNSRKKYRDTVANLLKKVELSPDYLFKSPSSIGGGEKQMVAIARALASNPSLVVLDEPTSALDVSVQAKIINRLIELQKELNLSYLFISHDLSLMRNMADRIVIMYLGKICEVNKANKFFEKPLHPYTKMLISSIPVIYDEEERLKPKRFISIGEIPSPVNIPSGCSFHLRCPLKMDICSKIDPETLEVSDGHLVRCHLYSDKK